MQGFISSGFTANNSHFCVRRKGFLLRKLYYAGENAMKDLQHISNNYWQASRKKRLFPRSRKVIWFIVKIALAILRLLCKLFDFFGGGVNDS